MVKLRATSFSKGRWYRRCYKTVTKFTNLKKENYMVHMNQTFHVHWIVTEIRLSVTEMCRMLGTLQWQFSQHSLTIQPSFNHQSVILFLSNRNFIQLSVNCKTERYVNCNTVLSLTIDLITLIPLCNCCDFHDNWKNCFMLRKQ